MPRARARKRLLWGALAVAVAAGTYMLIELATLQVRAAAVLLGVVDLSDPSGLTARVRVPVHTREGPVRLPGRELRALRYTPSDVSDPPVVVLLHGVHHLGIDEPRFQRFANSLASVGIEVVTPELSELLAYRVEPQTIADIRACAQALAAEYQRRPGAFGISFAGGLLLMAAAIQPPAFDYVVAVGAHHDLSRLARYYAGAPIEGPAGHTLPPSPDPYGARVIVRAHAERFFAASDVEAARRAISLHLAERYAEAREASQALSPEGQARMAVVLDAERFSELGALLLLAVERGELELDQVSPENALQQLTTPTFLIHGRDDPIIPSSETRWLAREMPAHALRRALVTPVLSHMDLSERLPLTDYWKVVRFVAAILEEASS